MAKSYPSFLTLLLLISFASVNAVLFTPALPLIAKHFSISASAAQLTMTWFLIGYAAGQLIYGPFANRFGRKPTLYAGIILQIASSILCVCSGMLHQYSVLVIGRLLLALGSGVGLKMTFTLVNEFYEDPKASQKLSYLMMAFAITPALSVMVGGYLTTHWGWMSTFYAGALYGVILLVLSTAFSETKLQLDIEALTFRHLIDGYLTQFKNKQLCLGGALMGSGTCFVYIFASLAPFIAINMMHLSVAAYGTANLFPPLGLLLGSFVSAQLIKYFKPRVIIGIGISSALLGSILMLIFILMQLSPLLALFLPMVFCYFGLALIFANASALAMRKVVDKAHGSAVMNFINMGLTTLVVLSLGLFQVHLILMPLIYLSICFLMLILNYFYLKD